jgi:hypothetical protein
MPLRVPALPSPLLQRAPLRSAPAVSNQAAQRQAQAAAGPMTRARFEQVVAVHFGVASVRTGTQSEQEDRLTPIGGMPPGGIHIPAWQSWDPGAGSETYQAIVDAFTDTAAAFGGVPPVREIVFFDRPFALGPNNVPHPAQSEAASYGAGTMTIYRRATTATAGLPVGRSGARGLRSPTLQVTGIEGQFPGAPIEAPAQTESTRRTIVHELGHGLEEAAHGPDPRTAPDPRMLQDYAREVGWTATAPPRLFDASIAAVRTALAAGQTPDARHEITAQDWNSPRHGEQPISHYSLTSPFEDFAEAVSAFVSAPSLLRARSSRRYAFLDTRPSLWQRNLLVVPQPGDYPLPSGDRRWAAAGTPLETAG